MKPQRKREVEGVTDPRTPSYLVLQLLRNGGRSVPFILAASGATPDLISALTKRHLIIRSRGENGANEMLRLSLAGIAVTEACAAIQAAK
jgi:hypothetical protein